MRTMTIEQARLRTQYTTECPEGFNPDRWRAILRFLAING